jgi:hypothetical protein
MSKSDQSMRMSWPTAVVAIALSYGSPVAADWNVTEYRDDKTDSRFSVAMLAAISGEAWLRVRCGNDRMFPAIILAKSVTPPDVVRLRATYKFDTSNPVSRMAMLADKGRELWLWVDEPLSTVQRISRGRRLSVELFPTGDEKMSLEFNLTGSDRIIPQVQCPRL